MNATNQSLKATLFNEIMPKAVLPDHITRKNLFINQIEMSDLTDSMLNIGSRYIPIKITSMPRYEGLVENLSVGFDPGNRLGFAFIRDGIVVFGNLLLNYGEWKNLEPAVVAYMFSYNFLKILQDDLGFHEVPFVAVEGAAMSRHPSQEFLSQIRTGLYLGAYHYIQDYLGGHHKQVYIVPPTIPRKVAFGNGKTKASAEFPHINPNAADALALAWFVMLKNYVKE